MIIWKNRKLNWIKRGTMDINAIYTQHYTLFAHSKIRLQLK